MDGDRSREFIDAALAAVHGMPVRIDFNEDPYKPSFVELTNIKATESRQGIGTEVMRSLAKLADEYQVGIKLHVEPFGDEKIPLRKLKQFYKQFGFRDRDLNWMVRLPTKVKKAMSKFPTLVKYGGALYKKANASADTATPRDDSGERVAHTIHYKGKRYELVKAWPGAGDVDEHQARDLYLTVDNDSRAYPTKMTIYKTLYNHVLRGDYDSDLAIKAFENLLSSVGLDIYKETMTPGDPLPNPATRRVAAQSMRDDFENALNEGYVPSMIGME